MKNVSVLFVMVLFVMAGCGGNKQANLQSNGIITIDVTKSYPKKEFILQDFMDVEYIPLESSNEFVTTGWLHAVGKDIIVVRNRKRAADGDIFIFDRNGKGLRKINHLGQGSEEYKFLLGVTLDEENEELFVNDHWTRKILVYDLFGNFKRSFDHKEGCMYDMQVYNFDRNHLICKDDAIGENMLGNPNVFLLVSKQDGSIVREIEIPYKEKISSMVFSEGGRSIMPIRNRVLVPHRDSWLLSENSSDTVYKYMPDHSMLPLIVRTPSIQSMNPRTFLYPAVLTDRYCFAQTVEAKWDWEKNTGHTRINLVYDNQEHAVFESVIYNADIEDKKPLIMTSEITFGDNEIACVQSLEAEYLVEAYEKGQLKGRLKEIAATLDEDANSVIMLIKYRK